MEELDIVRRAGDPAQLIASSKKARDALGWKTKHDSPEEIIEITCKCYSTSKRLQQDLTL